MHACENKYAKNGKLSILWLHACENKYTKNRKLSIVRLHACENKYSKNRKLSIICLYNLRDQRHVKILIACLFLFYKNLILILILFK